VYFDGFLAALKHGDSSRAYQIGFQDPATTTMEGIYLFNLHLLAVIIGIVLLVAWLLCAVLKNFTELTTSHAANFTHNNIIEII
jgi:heme/copper-type cytochrome/quinol oxidase subunit 2